MAARQFAPLPTLVLLAASAGCVGTAGWGNFSVEGPPMGCVAADGTKCTSTVSGREIVVTPEAVTIDGGATVPLPPGTRHVKLGRGPFGPLTGRVTVEADGVSVPVE